jgi:predicted metal-binding membrane protein
MATVDSRRTATPAVALTATLALAAACWAAAIWLMDGMDMGVATRPGSFGFFAAAWVTMMAAMMLPGAAQAIARPACAARFVLRRSSPVLTWQSGRSRASRRSDSTGRTGRWRPAWW